MSRSPVARRWRHERLRRRSGLRRPSTRNAAARARPIRRRPRRPPHRLHLPVAYPGRVPQRRELAEHLPLELGRLDSRFGDDVRGDHGRHRPLRSLDDRRLRDDLRPLDQPWGVVDRVRARDGGVRARARPGQRDPDRRRANLVLRRHAGHSLDLREHRAAHDLRRHDLALRQGELLDERVTGERQRLRGPPRACPLRRALRDRRRGAEVHAVRPVGLRRRLEPGGCPPRGRQGRACPRFGLCDLRALRRDRCGRPDGPPRGGRAAGRPDA